MCGNDVSGDGPNMSEAPIEVLRTEAVRKKITINSLAIERPLMPEFPDSLKGMLPEDRVGL